ncbi:MAG: hypothetical protein HQL53_11865, partial [Magnetococcales bacterium]|nr:hypothetical protein [Magnetococcales bacterium]
MTTTPEEHQKIKVFGRKKGKLRPDEVARMEQQLPGMSPPEAADRNALRRGLGLDAGEGRIWLEIGFGNGATLAELAARHPQDRFIGVEVFWEGIVSLMKRLDENGSDNVRVVRESAQWLLDGHLPPGSVD